MAPSTKQRLDELFNAMPVLLGGPTEINEIEVAERLVGMKLPTDYRLFLERYGGAIVGSLPILGLRRAEAMADDLYSVVELTSRFRADGWESTNDWVVISVDLGGNPIGLNSLGEVWVSDHDSGETVRLAPTFEDFLIQLLNE